MPTRASAKTPILQDLWGRGPYKGELPSEQMFTMWENGSSSACLPRRAYLGNTIKDGTQVEVKGDTPAEEDTQTKYDTPDDT